MNLKIRLTEKDLMPTRANPTDAGLDLRAAESKLIRSATPTLIDTGVSVQIPKNHVGLVFSRSGLAKHGITLANSVGVIDSDYRGNIMVSLICNVDNDRDVFINKGDRIAQLVVLPIVLPQVQVVDEDDEEWLNTARGTGGFGSTGKN
jgi:dUTP pyrophosphatase